MTFNGAELAAMVKLALAMAQADGYVSDEEKLAIALDLTKFGVKNDSTKAILAAAAVIEASDALKLVSQMGYEQKKYVTGYLAVIMAADGKVADSEMKMWRLVSALCNLPTMSVGEALTFWKNN